MENNATQKNHVCPTNGHCCECNGCNAGYGMCMHGGGMRRYWRRHFIVLVVGVILAFFVGMKLGEIKGYMMSYGFMPMHQRGWMMQRAYVPTAPSGAAGGTVLVGEPVGPNPEVQ